MQKVKWLLKNKSEKHLTLNNALIRAREKFIFLCVRA